MTMDMKLIILVALRMLIQQSLIMRQQKSKDCFHKIMAFQLHKNCKENASICQYKCQEIHPSNTAHTTVDVSHITLQHSKIKNQLIDAIKVYKDKFAKEYDQIMTNFQKKFTEILREMERQILTQLIKFSDLNNNVMEKIENQRLEKLKCHEIYNLINDRTVEQKIKSAPLLPIYQKHLNGLRIYYKNFNWNVFGAQEKQEKKETKETSEQKNLPGNRLKEDIIKQNQTLKIQIQSLKAQLKSYQKKCSAEARISKRDRLSMKTWTILRVITKKRLKKQHKDKEIQENKEKLSCQHPPVSMDIERPIQPQKPNQFPNSPADSQDILDFIQRRQLDK